MGCGAIGQVDDATSSTRDVEGTSFGPADGGGMEAEIVQSGQGEGEDVVATADADPVDVLIHSRCCDAVDKGHVRSVGARSWGQKVEAANRPEGKSSNLLVVMAGGDGELVVRGCLGDMQIVSKCGGDDLRVKVGGAAEVLDVEEVLGPVGKHDVPFVGSS